MKLLLPLALAIGCLNSSCNSDSSLKNATDSSAKAQDNIAIGDSQSSIKYTVLHSDQGLIDVLVDSCTKQSCRWVVKQVLNTYGNRCSVDLWTSRKAFNKYIAFYNEQDSAYEKAQNAVDFRKRMKKNGKDVKQRLISTEDIRGSNVIASYGDGYIYFFADKKQETF